MRALRSSIGSRVISIRDENVPLLEPTVGSPKISREQMVRVQLVPFWGAVQTKTSRAVIEVAPAAGTFELGAVGVFPDRGVGHGRLLPGQGATGGVARQGRRAALALAGLAPPAVPLVGALTWWGNRV